MVEMFDCQLRSQFYDAAETGDLETMGAMAYTHGFFAQMDLASWRLTAAALRVAARSNQVKALDWLTRVAPFAKALAENCAHTQLPLYCPDHALSRASILEATVDGSACSALSWLKKTWAVDAQELLDSSALRRAAELGEVAYLEHAIHIFDIRTGLRPGCAPDLPPAYRSIVRSAFAGGQMECLDLLWTRWHFNAIYMWTECEPKCGWDDYFVMAAKLHRINVLNWAYAMYREELITALDGHPATGHPDVDAWIARYITEPAESSEPAEAPTVPEAPTESEAAPIEAPLPTTTIAAIAPSPAAPASHPCDASAAIATTPGADTASTDPALTPTGADAAPTGAGAAPPSAGAAPPSASTGADAAPTGAVTASAWMAQLAVLRRVARERIIACEHEIRTLRAVLQSLDAHNDDLKRIA